MSADYPKPSCARSPETRAAAALERIAARLESMHTDAEEEDLDYLELQREKVEMHAARDAAIRERDEARRERDIYRELNDNQATTIGRVLHELDEATARCRKLEVVAFNGATIGVAPGLSWSPEPPKVEGLYLYKSTSPIVGWVGASTYSKATIETAKWQPDLLWAGPLSIAPFQAPGAGGEA